MKIVCVLFVYRMCFFRLLKKAAITGETMLPTNCLYSALCIVYHFCLLEYARHVMGIGKMYISVTLRMCWDFK